MELLFHCGRFCWGDESSGNETISGDGWETFLNVINTIYIVKIEGKKVF